MEFAYPLDGKQDYVASQAGAFNGTRTSGVWAGAGNLLPSVTAARQITISKGQAWFTTDEYWGKVYVNTANVNFILPTADGVLDRICRFVIRWNKTLNQAKLMMLEGELSSQPAAPARNTTDELYDLVIADYKVLHGETEASPARLTDQRLNEELCGLMRDGVTRLPTDAFQAQAEALIGQLEEELSAAQGGTAYELKRLQFTDTVVQPLSFIEDDTYTDFPLRAAVPLVGVLENMTPEVVLGVSEAMSGNFAPVAETYTGGVYIYAASAPEAEITIPTIIAWKAVGA